MRKVRVRVRVLAIAVFSNADGVVIRDETYIFRSSIRMKLRVRELQSSTARILKPGMTGVPPNSELETSISKPSEIITSGCGEDLVPLLFKVELYSG